MLRSAFIWMFLSIVLFAATEARAMPKQDQTFKDWTVFSVEQNGTDICYMTSSPIKQDGNFSRRGEPYLLITHRGSGKSEISVSSGYPYKKGSEVDLDIDGKFSRKLFTSDETPRIGWAKTAEDDNDIAVNMKKGQKVTVKGVSQLGTNSTDVYSLSGFTAAFKRMVSLCK